MPFRDFNVLDAADRAADMVNALIDRSPAAGCCTSGR
jgi:hypothetical protein